ncbi:MAG: hypothetical protein AAGE59_14745 [Cyanobacteria bacterium P01_F01_bin.86]
MIPTFTCRTVSTAIALAIPTLLMSGPAALAEALQFTLINDSSQDVYYLYVSPSESDDWGEDILGDEIIPSGTTSEIVIDDGLATCEYDLLAISVDEDEVEDYGLNLCEISTYTISD